MQKLIVTRAVLDRFHWENGTFRHPVELTLARFVEQEVNDVAAAVAFPPLPYDLRTSVVEEQGETTVYPRAAGQTSEEDSNTSLASSIRGLVCYDGAFSDSSLRPASPSHTSIAFVTPSFLTPLPFLPLPPPPSLISLP